MSSDSLFVTLDRDRWRVAHVRPDGHVDLHEADIPASEDPQASDLPLSDRLKEVGYAGQAACLGLSSDLVLSAQIDCADLPRRQQRAAMLYRLEEQLPINAEALTANFMPALGGRALGLSVETERVRATIDRLTKLGVEVAVVSPTALLVFWEVNRINREACDYVVVAQDSTVDIFRTVQGRLVAWYGCSTEADEVLRSMEADLLGHPVENTPAVVRLLGDLPKDTLERLKGDPGISITQDAQALPLHAAAQAAGRVLAGKGPSWLDFRRDALALPNAWKRVAMPLGLAATLFLVFSAALAGVFMLRGMRYRDIVRDREERQSSIYGDLFPGQEMPPNVRSRLKSELSRLSGISGTGFEMPDRPSALNSLQQIVSNLPPQLRLRIVEVRIDPEGLFVEGQVQNHSDAEVISRALARTGLDIAPPRTENLSTGGVSFILTGKLSGKVEKSKPVSPPEAKR